MFSKAGRTVVVLGVACAVSSMTLGAHASTTIGGVYAGTSGYYDYSVHEVLDTSADTETVYWCGDNPGHVNDTILEMQYKASTWTVQVPEKTAFQETPGAWDSEFTCNPSSAVKGTFTNPFGDGVTYGYVIYYVGIASGHDNQIGAAFSQDGLNWKKYPSPVVTYTDPVSQGDFYGNAQPSAAIFNGQLELFYEIGEGSVNTHWTTSSSDGVHFGSPAQVTAAGLGAAEPTWGGIAYSPADSKWYAMYGRGWRPSSTTGGIQENGDWGVSIYSTSDISAGTWTELDTIDTSLTGDETNFLGDFLKNPDGTVSSAFYPSLKVLVSSAWPRPAYNATGSALANDGVFNNWQLSWHEWTPGNPWRPLTRVDYAGGQHEVTTGWWDSSVYHAENINLGKLAEAPTGDANMPVWSCKAWTTDYILTKDSNCLGRYKLGMVGYAYSTAAANRIALWRCTVPNVGDFVSNRSDCEGQQIDEFIGYSQN